MADTQPPHARARATEPAEAHPPGVHPSDASPSDAQPSQAKMGRRLLAGVFLGALVYAGFAAYGDFHSVVETIRHFPLILLPAAMALSFANYVVRFWRWERYRKLLAIELERGTSFSIYLAGLALTVTPGKMGEALKSWLIRRVNGTPIHVSAPIVIAERFTDLLGFLILIAIGGIASEPEYQWVFWATLGLCAVLLALAGSRRCAGLGLALARHTPLVRRVAPGLEGALASTRVLLAPRELALPTLVAALGWSLECIAFWTIASALVDGGVPFLFATYTYALSAVAGAVLILFPGGLGVTEASMGGLLRKRYIALGVLPANAPALAVSATLLIRLCTLWFAVGVGLVALFCFSRRFGKVDGPHARGA